MMKHTESLFISERQRDGSHHRNVVSDIVALSISTSRSMYLPVTNSQAAVGLNSVHCMSYAFNRMKESAKATTSSEKVT